MIPFSSCTPPEELTENPSVCSVHRNDCRGMRNVFRRLCLSCHRSNFTSPYGILRTHVVQNPVELAKGYWKPGIATLVCSLYFTTMGLTHPIPRLRIVGKHSVADGD